MSSSQESPFVSPGVYRLQNGMIFVVKWNRQKTRVYAKQLVESTERVTEEGDHVNFDFIYAPGAIYNITPEHLMNIEEAKKLIVKYSRCIACGKRLKLASSVEKGIGPVCIKYFGGVLQ